MTQLPNIVILGDYENALRRFSKWDKLEQRANLIVHHEPLHEEALYEAIKDADAIAIVRDRAPLNEAMIARLPKLKFLMFTGERNGTLATGALTSRNIPIGCTPSGPSKETTAELTWALILGASKRLVEENKLIASGCDGFRLNWEPCGMHWSCLWNGDCDLESAHDPRTRRS